MRYSHGKNLIELSKCLAKYDRINNPLRRKLDFDSSRETQADVGVWINGQETEDERDVVPY